MCQIFDISAFGENQNSLGIPQFIQVYARITEDCKEVSITVFKSNGDVLANDTITKNGAVNDFNGIPTWLAKLNISTEGIIECDDELSISVACTQGGNCTDKQTVIVACKHPVPEDENCPGVNDIGIALSFAGNPVDLTQGCAPSGTYSALATSVPSGSSFIWTLTIGTLATSLPGTNPVTFNLPAGTENTSLTVIVIPPASSNCPPTSRTIVIPERFSGDCQQPINFELRKNGILIPLPYVNLESGGYVLTVISPVGTGIQYTYFINDAYINSGTNNTLSFPVQGGGATTEVLVIVDISDCCPPLQNSVDLISGEDEDIVVEEPEGDPNDGNPSNEEDDDTGGWSICGFLYGLLMVAVFAFIATWVLGWSTIPPIVPSLIAAGVLYLVILVLLATMKSFCSMSTCRALRIQAWMFFWTAIACLIAWVASVFLLAGLLIGLLIAGILALTVGLILNSKGCSAPNLFGWP